LYFSYVVQKNSDTGTGIGLGENFTSKSEKKKSGEKFFRDSPELSA
jgi:hypothetical protein